VTGHFYTEFKLSVGLDCPAHPQLSVMFLVERMTAPKVYRVHLFF